MMNQVMFQLATIKKQILKNKGKPLYLKIYLQNNLRKKLKKPLKFYTHGGHLLRMINFSFGQNKMNSYLAGLLTCVS